MCSETLKRDVINSGNTSVKKVPKNSGKLTPNIVNKGELIRIGAGKASKVNVYDVSGALKSFYKNTEYIPTCGLIQGIYVAHIDIENTLMKGKFIVQ